MCTRRLSSLCGRPRNEQSVPVSFCGVVGVVMTGVRHRVDGPALAVGLIVLGYWLRVLWKAMKLRARTGRGGNFVPAERVGFWVRLIWQPVVWGWITIPLVVALGQPRWWVFRLFYDATAVRWIAVGGVALAFAATWVCWRRMGRSWRMGIDPNERTALVVTGPYRVIRHPIYALSAMLMICTVIAAPTPLLLVAAVVHIALLRWEAIREERYLSRVHGESFERYCAGVGRFFPVLPRRNSTAAIIA